MGDTYLDFFIKGLLIALAFGVPAGAIGALTIQRTLEKGFKYGLSTGLGSTAVDVLYAAVGVFGLTVISDTILSYQFPIRVVGCILIIIYGIVVLRKKPVKNKTAYDRADSVFRCFTSAFVIAALNPATIISFSVAFTSFGLGGSIRFPGGLFVLIGILIGTSLWWVALSLVVNAFRNRITEKIYRILNVILGVFLIIFAIAVMADLIMSILGTGTDYGRISDESMVLEESVSVPTEGTSSDSINDNESNADASKIYKITPSGDIRKIEDGLLITEVIGDYGFDRFLELGGAGSDKDVFTFLAGNLLSDVRGLDFDIEGMGCSTISVKGSDEGFYFGRNFDWNKCNALIMVTRPVNGYSSISTVNSDFIRQAVMIPVSDETMKLAAVYAPLDGMNEMGLAVSVNMIQDTDTIEQNTKRGDITTTTAVRLLLDKARDVEEALELLESYDLHASFGYMIHFAIADAQGHSVAVEYIDNEMSVIETPILTNFYLTEGDKYGIGTAQSHTRYEIMQAALAEKASYQEADVRDILSSVSKKNFGEFESTEWSVVFDQKTKNATYYHRENYSKGYKVCLED